MVRSALRWVVFGIALNHVLLLSIRPVLEQEILKEYNDLKLNHNIDVQTAHSFPSPRYPARSGIDYKNINGNDTKLKGHFDYKVTSHVDFAKLFLQNHMAQFNAFNETCDASAVLSLLARIPVFSVALQNAATVVREARNAWTHCKFTEWDEANFKKRFSDMKNLVKEVGLLPADESKVLTDLNDWETKGTEVFILFFISFLVGFTTQYRFVSIQNYLYLLSVFETGDFNKSKFNVYLNTNTQLKVKKLMLNLRNDHVL